MLLGILLLLRKRKLPIELGLEPLNLSLEVLRGLGLALPNLQIYSFLEGLLIDLELLPQGFVLEPQLLHNPLATALTLGLIGRWLIWLRMPSWRWLPWRNPIDGRCTHILYQPEGFRALVKKMYPRCSSVLLGRLGTFAMHMILIFQVEGGVHWQVQLPYSKVLLAHG